MSQDYGRIKANIGKMIDMGAPEADIDAYLQEEGVTAEQLRAAPKPNAATPQQPKQPKANPRPDLIPVDNAKEVTEKLFPGVRVTDWRRDPNSPLGQANTDSWHNRSGAAVDVDPSGRSFEDMQKVYEANRYHMIEAIDEVKNPSGHATGPHYHYVLGRTPIDAAAFDNAEQAKAIQDMIDGGKTADEIIARFPKLESVSGNRAAIEWWINARRSGDKRPMVFNALNPDPPALPPPPTTPPAAAEGERADFFSLPSADQLTEGLAKGAGNVVEGIGDVAGIVVNPLNTTLFRGLGYDDYTSDFGKTLREATGLPEDDTFLGEVNKAAAGGLGWSGAAKGFAALARPGVVQKALTALGSTPGQDVVSSVMATTGSKVAEEAGAGPVGQTIAGLVAGGVGPSVANRAATEARTVKNNRFVKREVQNPEAPYHAEVAQDVASLAKLRDNAPRRQNFKNTIDTKALNNLEKQYMGRFTERLNEMELPAARRIALKEAYDQRYSMGDEGIAALRDGTPEGEFLAEAVMKSRALRNLTTREPRTVRKALVTAGNLVDWVPFIPPRVGDKLRAVGRFGTQDDEATRVLAAAQLAKKADLYRRVQQEVGPSPHGDAKRAFVEASDGAMIAREEAAAAKAAEQQAKAEARAAKASEPRKPRPKPMTEMDMVIQRNIESGLKGDSGTQRSFMGSLGISEKNLMRVLDHVEKTAPELASEINRIRWNYPTKGKVGPILRPLMQKSMDELGIAKRTPKEMAPVEAAMAPKEALAAPQSPVEAAMAPQPEATAAPTSPIDEAMGPAPEAPAKVEEDGSGVYHFGRINRPAAWANGKASNQRRADAAIQDLMEDQSIQPTTFDLIKRVPEQIRDGFKTVEEARNFIDEEIMLTLRSEGVSDAEMKAIRSHLYDIADHKKYRTIEAYDKEFKVENRRSRGRPRKDAAE